MAGRARGLVGGRGRSSDLTEQIDALTFGRLRGVDRLDYALLLLSIASSAAFMATRLLQPFPGAVVLKALGMAPLAAVAFRVLDEAKSRDRLILPAALALSCVGDVFLQLDFRRYFVHGLAAFLLAHLTYILLFARHWPRPLRASAGRKMLAALIPVYGVLMCAWLWDVLARFLAPGLAYAAALTAMTVSATLAGFARPFVLLGALLFLISDSLLAAGFKLRAPLGAFLIWPTYYAGQYAITMGVLREAATADRPPAR